jgi:hypothetical protein
MPYIAPARRERIAAGDRPRNSGELNYVISMAVKDFLSVGYGYSDINDAIGALEGAKLELYRRIAAPYEDGKVVENGDIYDEGKA